MIACASAQTDPTAIRASAASSLRSRRPVCLTVLSRSRVLLARSPPAAPRPHAWRRHRAGARRRFPRSCGDSCGIRAASNRARRRCGRERGPRSSRHGQQVRIGRASAIGTATRQECSLQRQRVTRMLVREIMNPRSAVGREPACAWHHRGLGANPSHPGWRSSGP